MKKIQKIQMAMTISIATIWGMVIFYALICRPSGTNAYGYYSDPIDNEFASQIVAKHGETVANFYQPLSWLIEPHAEGEISVLGIFTMLVNFAILISLVVLGGKFGEGFENRFKCWLYFCILAVFGAYVTSYAALALL